MSNETKDPADLTERAKRIAHAYWCAMGAITASADPTRVWDAGTDKLRDAWLAAARAVTPQETPAAETIAAAEAAGRQGRDALAAWWNAATREQRLQVIDGARHLLSVLGGGAPAGVPEGWKLVPVEPTPEMVRAAVYAVITPDGGLLSHAVAVGRYRAMLSAAPTAQGQGWGKALEDIAAERRRQIEGEGYDPSHDDGYTMSELLRAAVSYIKGFPEAWPWHSKFWKPRDERRNLVKAGALIVAEIERLDRASAPASTSAGEVK